MPEIKIKITAGGMGHQPGKFKLEKRIIKTNLVLKTINWYRTKSNIPPLIFK